MISIIGFVLGLALAYIPVSCYLNYRKCPGIKGPFLASISSWWLFKVTATQQVYRAFPAALDKYGMFRGYISKAGTADVP